MMIIKIWAISGYLAAMLLIEIWAISIYYAPTMVSCNHDDNQDLSNFQVFAVMLIIKIRAILVFLFIGGTILHWTDRHDQELLLKSILTIGIFLVIRVSQSGIVWVDHWTTASPVLPMNHWLTISQSRRCLWWWGLLLEDHPCSVPSLEMLDLHKHSNNGLFLAPHHLIQHFWLFLIISPFLLVLICQQHGPFKFIEFLHCQVFRWPWISSMGLVFLEELQSRGSILYSKPPPNLLFSRKTSPCGAVFWGCIWWNGYQPNW